MASPEYSVLADNNVVRYEGRLPDPSDHIQYGGRPGCKYAMIATENMGAARDEGWEPCREVPIITVVGPAGAADLVYFAKGKPIEGVSPANGVRSWVVDRTIIQKTGLFQQDGEQLNLKAPTTPKR